MHAGLPCTPPPDEQGPRTLGWRQLATDPGVLRSVPSEDNLRGLPGGVIAEVNAGAGQQARDAGGAAHIRAGRVVVAGADEREVEDRLRYAATWFRRNRRVDALQLTG